MEEAGKYLEMYKLLENKPADLIQAHVEGDYMSKVCQYLVSKSGLQDLAFNVFVEHFCNEFMVCLASEYHCFL